MNSPKKTWNPTKHRCLVRHHSGTYYARTKRGNKLHWKSLETKTLSIALPRLRDHLAAESGRKESVCEAFGEIPKTMGDLHRLRLERIRNDFALKESTRHYWRQIFVSMKRSWAGFDDLKINKVTRVQCEKWAAHFASQVSPTRYNNAVAGLRHLFEIAIEKGSRSTNPAAGLKRQKIKTKNLDQILPTKAEFCEWVEAIRGAGGRFSQHCANFVEFLSYSGLRVGEAKWVEWWHCDFSKSEILVTGDPESGTKNREVRRVPMIEPLRDLLSSMRRQRHAEDPSEKVLKVNEAQKAMDNAAERVGIARLTHHDLRHLFATVCIESGVDIPTVARWLGHKDGGALAMKVYGHPRDEHSRASARKVKFG